MNRLGLAQRIAGCGLIIGLLCGTFTTPAWSAEKPATAPPPASAQKTAAEPVFAVTEVIPRSESALSRLSGIREKLDADTSVSVVETGLPKWAQQLDLWLKAESRILSNGGSVQRVNDLLLEWTRREAQLNAWNVLLVNSSKAWIAEEQTLDRIKANWQETLSAVKADAPLAVRDKIVEVLREEDAVRRVLQGKIARLVAVQVKLSDQYEVINKTRRQIVASSKQSGLGLLSLDSPPLWMATSGADTERSMVSQVSADWLALYNEAINFLQLAQTRLLLHLLLLGVLVGFLLLVRREARSAGVINLTPAEQYVLERSFLSALLLAMLLAPLFYPDASPRLIRLVCLPALIPILGLSPAILAPRLRIGIYVFVVIFLVDFLRSYVPPHLLLARLLLLCEAAIGAVSILALLRMQQREKWAAGMAGSMRYLLPRIGGLLFLGSLVANVVGNLTFAEYLVSPLVRVIFLGIAIRLSAVATTTFVAMILRTPLASLSRVVRQQGESAAASLRHMVNLAGAALWIYMAVINLGLLAILQDTFALLMGQEWRVGAATISARDLVSFLLVFVAAYVLSRALRVVLTEEIFPRIHLPRGIPDVLELLARYGVLLFGFMLALAAAGVDLSRITLALSALGVGLGFGLQHIVNNFVSGLILVFEHPIQVGDFIEVGSHEGQVRQIGFRASVIRQRDGADVIIPNGELIGSKVLNWSLSNQLRRLNVAVPIPLGTDANRVIDILQTVARACPQVVADPSPIAVLAQFGESALKFQLLCWVHGEHYYSARDQLALAIDKALEEARIPIPFPQADVHVHFPAEQVVKVASTDSRM